MQELTSNRYEVLYPKTNVGQVDGYIKPWKVGDVLVTNRNDLSDNWLLCNGTQIIGENYPLLSNLRRNTPLDSGYIKVNTNAFNGIYDWQNRAAMGRLGQYKLLFALTSDFKSLGMWYSLDGEVWTLKQINGVNMASEIFSAWTTPIGNDPFICLHDTRSGTSFLMKVNEDLSYTISSDVLYLRYVRSICFKDNKVYMCTSADGSNGPFISTVDIKSDGTFGNARKTPITSLSHTATDYNYAQVYTNGTTVFGAFAHGSSPTETDFFSLKGSPTAIQYTKIKTVSGLSLGFVTYDAVRNCFVSVGNYKVYVSENGSDWIEKGTISGNPEYQRQFYITETGDYIINRQPEILFSSDGGASWTKTNNTGLKMIGSTQINNNWYTFSLEDYYVGSEEKRRFQMNKLLNKKVLPTYTPADNLSAYIKAKEGE